MANYFTNPELLLLQRSRDGKSRKDIDEFYRKGVKPMEKVTLCKFCKWSMAAGDYNRIPPYCKSSEAPITNFFDGSKDVGLINTDGKCPFYKDRRQNKE